MPDAMNNPAALGVNTYQHTIEIDISTPLFQIYGRTPIAALSFPASFCGNEDDEE
jgi:hypothetical protein